jgi:hypothetical protein
LKESFSRSRRSPKTQHEVFTLFFFSSTHRMCCCRELGVDDDHHRASRGEEWKTKEARRRRVESARQEHTAHFVIKNMNMREPSSELIRILTKVRSISTWRRSWKFVVVCFIERISASVSPHARTMLKTGSQQLSPLLNGFEAHKNRLIALNFCRE